MTHYHETADYAGAKEALARTMAIARREGDVALEVLALANASHTDGDEHRWDEALEKSLRAIDLARQADNSRAEQQGRRSTWEALMARGDFEGARMHAAAGLAAAERLRQASPLSQALWANMAVAYHEGDWRSARAFTDRGLTVAPGDGHNLRGRAQLEYAVGDYDEGEAFLERLVEVTHLRPPGPNQLYAMTALVIPEIAHMTGVTHRLDVAEAAAKVVLSSAFAIPRFAMGARTGLALILVLRGDAGGAAEQYPALESQRGTVLPRNFITVDRLLGLLAQTMGNLDKGAEHFEDALAFCRRAGYRPELAWSLCDYADALLAKGVSQYAPISDQRARAMSLLDEALAISHELGMRPLMERVLSRREILKA